MAGRGIGRDPIRVDKSALNELRKAVRFLPEAVANRRTLVGMKRAMRPTLQAAKSDSPQRSGALKSAYHVVSGKRSRKDSPYVVLRVNPKKRQSYTTADGTTVERRPTDYFHWVADGQGPKTYTTTKKGFSFRAYDEDGRPLVVKKITRGGFKGTDIIGDAWQATRRQVVDSTMGHILRAVNEYKSKKGFK